ncbi:P-loop containing nucleoside triphosphate hydrolase protein [Xylaria arbuscula]|nr:P-loop containing nucleoside triphosphate hydrolase protein [Xylaria arbuscula]
MLRPMKRLLSGPDGGEDIQCVAERPPKRLYKTDDPGYSAPGPFAPLGVWSGRYIGDFTPPTPPTPAKVTYSYEDQFYNDGKSLQRNTIPFGTYQEFPYEELLTGDAEQSCLYLEPNGYQGTVGIDSKEVFCIDTTYPSESGAVQTCNLRDTPPEPSFSLTRLDDFVAGQEENDSLTVPDTQNLTSQYGLAIDLDTTEETPDDDSYDICLGHVVLEDISLRADFLKPKEERSILLVVRGEVVILRDSTSKEYAGLLNSKAASVIISLFAGHKDMGLGKTLTVLALIVPWARRRQARGIHFKPGSVTFTTYHGPGRRDSAPLQGFDIVLTTYDILRSETTSLKRSDKKNIRQLGLLHGIIWQRLVLDEAHVIRNRKQAFRACCDIQAVHRWCLTGTPIQNTVEDLGALVEFLRVYPFDRRDAFKNSFMDQASGKVSSFDRLRILVQAISLRRTKACIGTELNIPPKQEIIQSISLNEDERYAYDMLKRNATSGIDSRTSTRSVLSLILRLRQVCNHGRDLLPKPTQEWLENASLYRDQSIPMVLTCENCDSTIQDNEPDGMTLPCLHQICTTCMQSKDTRDNKQAACPICNNPSLDTEYEARSITPHHRMYEDINYRPSSKVLALLHNLQADNKMLLPGKTPFKSVVFSTWTRMLDLIGKALTLNNIAFQRLDGSCSLTQRREAISSFRDDPRYTVMLATLGCAGVGLDLTMASRVHLMEPAWNPMLERQALDRVHRLGQTREVIETRYIVEGSDSIEEHILRVQKRKSETIAASFEKANPNSDFVVQGFLKEVLYL